MAQISLGELRNLWKNVSDWVTGISESTPVVRCSSSSTLYAGTTNVTTDAAAIGSSQACTKVLIQTDEANSVDILIGNSTSQVFKIGTTMKFIELDIDNVASVYAKTESGTATLRWLALG